MLDSFCESTSLLTLRSGYAHCEVLTAGGCLGAWSVNGQGMLRAAHEEAIRRLGAFGSASFPLVPFSNRIADGRFSWAGGQVALARNFWPEPHAIHGVGFERVWQVAAQEQGAVSLVLHYPGGAAWPYPFRAEQQYRLEADRLRIVMRATNLAEFEAPLAFGHHPYFPRAGAHLRFQAAHVWLSGDDALPILKVRPSEGFDFSAGARVSRRDVDHCFTGWDGQALLSWEGKPLALEINASPNLRCAVVYSSADKDEFCFEPVPHLNDAINRTTDFAMPVIAPGEAFESQIELRAIAAP